MDGDSYDTCYTSDGADNQSRPDVRKLVTLVLSDRDIKKAIQFGHITFDPPVEPERIQPCSVDVRLSPVWRDFGVYENGWLDVADLQPDHTVERTMIDGLLLRPGAFILGSTVEVVSLGRMYAARIEGKSSLGRLGLSVHETAGFIDPGFHGNITLEIKNNNSRDIILRPGMKIAQLAFFHLSSTPERTYDAIGHYNGQMGPTESRFRLS